MFGFNIQKNRWSQFVKTRKYKVSVIGLNPVTDWRSIMLGIILVLILIAVNGYTTHYNIVTISEKDIDVNTTKHRIIDVGEVNEKLEVFQRKEERLEVLLNVVSID